MTRLATAVLLVAFSVSGCGGGRPTGVGTGIDEAKSISSTYGRDKANPLKVGRWHAPRPRYA